MASTPPLPRASPLSWVPRMKVNRRGLLGAGERRGSQACPRGLPQRRGQTDRRCRKAMAKAGMASCGVSGLLGHRQGPPSLGGGPGLPATRDILQGLRGVPHTASCSQALGTPFLPPMKTCRPRLR